MITQLQRLFDISNQKALQGVYYVLIFDFLFTFNDWMSRGYLTKESVEQNEAICWPYFQSCLDLYVFSAVPHGYSLSVLYMVFGSLVFLSLYFAYQSKWSLALASLFAPALFKFLMIYVFSYLTIGNYNVISLFLGLLLLFAKDKLYSLKILFSLFYLSAAVIKFNEGYLSGSIFTSLELGVPILPAVLLPYYGIAFILLVAITPVLLWSKNSNLRYFSILTLTAFHVYSISMVGFRYPALCIPILWILFKLADYQEFSLKRIFKDYFTIVVVFFLMLAQSLPILIAGNERLSSEGEKYGFYMYTANRQCVRTINLVYENGTREDNTYEERRGMRRCDPYEDWFRIQQACKQENIKNIEWQFNVSINGAYFHTLVDTKNACEIKTYKPFTHNDWLTFDSLNKSIPVLKNSI